MEKSIRNVFLAFLIYVLFITISVVSVLFLYIKLNNCYSLRTTSLKSECMLHRSVTARKCIKCINAVIINS